MHSYGNKKYVLSILSALALAFALFLAKSLYGYNNRPELKAEIAVRNMKVAAEMLEVYVRTMNSMPEALDEKFLNEMKKILDNDNNDKDRIFHDLPVEMPNDPFNLKDNKTWAFHARTYKHAGHHALFVNGGAFHYYKICNKGYLLLSLGPDCDLDFVESDIRQIKGNAGSMELLEKNMLRFEGKIFSMNKFHDAKYKVIDGDIVRYAIYN